MPCSLLLWHETSRWQHCCTLIIIIKTICNAPSASSDPEARDTVDNGCPACVHVWHIRVNWQSTRCLVCRNQHVKAVQERCKCSYFWTWCICVCCSWDWMVCLWWQMKHVKTGRCLVSEDEPPRKDSRVKLVQCSRTDKTQARHTSLSYVHCVDTGETDESLVCTVVPVVLRWHSDVHVHDIPRVSWSTSGPSPSDVGFQLVERSSAFIQLLMFFCVCVDMGRGWRLHSSTVDVFVCLCRYGPCLTAPFFNCWCFCVSV